MLHKLSAITVQNVLRQSADQLRESAAELAYERELRKEAEATLAQHNLEGRLLKIATEMDAKGLNSNLSVAGKVEELRRPENIGRLDAIEDAVGLAAEQVKLAHIDTSDVDAHGVGGDGVDPAAARFYAGVLGD